MIAPTPQVSRAAVMSTLGYIDQFCALGESERNEPERITTFAHEILVLPVTDLPVEQRRKATCELLRLADIKKSEGLNGEVSMCATMLLNQCPLGLLRPFFKVLFDVVSGLKSLARTPDGTEDLASEKVGSKQYIASTAI